MEIRKPDPTLRNSSGHLTRRRLLKRLGLAAVLAGVAMGGRNVSAAGTCPTSDDCPDQCDTDCCTPKNVCSATDYCDTQNICTEDNHAECDADNQCWHLNKCGTNMCDLNDCYADDVCVTRNYCTANVCFGTNKCEKDDWCWANACPGTDVDCGMFDVSCPIDNG